MVLKYYKKPWATHREDNDKSASCELKIEKSFKLIEKIFTLT